MEALKAQRTGQAQERLIPSHTWRDEGFPNSVGGVWDPNKVGQAFRAAMKRAGLEEHQRGLHALRHSTASVLLGAGVSPELAAKIMGHKNVSTFTDL